MCMCLCVCLCLCCISPSEKKMNILSVFKQSFFDPALNLSRMALRIHAIF
jgi:hypothetical protein